MVFVALLALLGASLSLTATAEPLVFAFAKTTATDPKPLWHQVGTGCSLEEPGAEDGLVRCAETTPGDDPGTSSLPPIDQWHSPVSILD